VPTPVDLGSWSRGSGAVDGAIARSGLLRVDHPGGRDLLVVRSRRDAGILDHEIRLEVVRSVAGGRVRDVDVVLSGQRRGASGAEHEVLRVNRRIRHGGRVERRGARRDRSSRVVRAEHHVRGRRSGVHHVHPRNRRRAGHLGDQGVGGSAVGDDRGLVRRGSSVQRRQRGGGDDRDHRHDGSGPKTGRHACPPCTYNVRSKRTNRCGRVPQADAVSTY